jgi:hypothetical protein
MIGGVSNFCTVHVELFARKNVNYHLRFQFHASMSSKCGTWSIDDVASQLTDNGFPAIIPIFKENEITGDMFPYITEDHLKEIGITSIGQRLLVLQFISDTVGIVVQSKTAPSAPQYSDPPVSYPAQQTFPDPRRAQASAPAARSKPAAAPAKPPENPENVPKYKRDHDKMVETIRAARKYAAYEKAVQEGRAVGPPPELPPIEEPPGLVQCPNCGRKFGEDAYHHHAGVCERMNANKRTPVRAKR